MKNKKRAIDNMLQYEFLKALKDVFKKRDDEMIREFEKIRERLDKLEKND